MRLMLISGVLLMGCSVAVFVWIAAPLSCVLFIPALVLMVKNRGRILTAFGTAAWATPQELRDAGMLRDRGLIIGRGLAYGLPQAAKALFDRRVPEKEAVGAFMQETLRKWKFRAKAPLVRLPNAVHTAVFAPTGVGKGVSFVIPQLLSCPESIVCVDFKGELSSITAEHRRKVFGHRVVILDPFRVVTQTPDCYNPLDFIPEDNPESLDECRDLAESQVIRTGQEKDPHWADMAEVWIGSLIAATVHYGTEGNRSLQTVRDLLSNPAKLEALIKLLCESDAWHGMLARLGNQLTNSKDKELASTLTTTNRFLRYLDTIPVAESTGKSTFDPAELRDGKMTVYLVLPPEHMRAQSALLRMWLVSLLRAVVRGGLGEANKVHFLLDESASLGKMDAIADALDKYRGYGVRLQFYYQSIGQLKTCWPDGQDQTLLSNVTQIYFGVNDLETAKAVSERLGERTIVVESGGTSVGTSKTFQSHNGQTSVGLSRNHSSNWQQKERRLLKPEEVLALDQRTAITFTPGVRPIRTRLIRFYEEKNGFFESAVTQARMLAFCVVYLVLALTAAGLAEVLREEAVRVKSTGVLRGGEGGAGNYAPASGQGGYSGNSPRPDVGQLRQGSRG